MSGAECRDLGVSTAREEAEARSVLLVVPVHDREEELCALLDSLGSLELGGVQLQVAVVDDASPDPLGAGLIGKYRQLELVVHRNNTAKGPGYCRNLAVRSHTSDFIWFLDSDTEVTDRGVLCHMTEVLASRENVAGVGGVLEDCGDGRVLQQLEVLPNFFFMYRSHEPESFRAMKVDGIGTCNLLIKRSVFERTGGFSEELARDEDNDLCLTLGELGYEFHQDAKTVVWHKCSTSGRASGKFAHFSDRQRYIRDLLRTRVALLAKHRPWELPFLPLIDACLAPLYVWRIYRGYYATKRFDMGASASPRKGGVLRCLLIESTRAYLGGLGLLQKNLAGRGIDCRSIS